MLTIDNNSKCIYGKVYILNNHFLHVSSFNIKTCNGIKGFSFIYYFPLFISFIPL